MASGVCTKFSVGVSSLQWVFSWSQQLAVSFQLETAVCSEFSVGDSSLQWVFSWRQQFAVSFQLETAVCSEFSVGDSSLQWVFSWRQQFAVSFQLETAVCSEFSARVRSLQWVFSWRQELALSAGVNIGGALRASFSGTFLLTLPDWVMPLKGHSLSPRSCPLTRQHPLKGLGADKTVEAT